MTTPPAPPPRPPPSPFDEIQQKTTFAAALAYAKPLMGDSVNKTDEERGKRVCFTGTIIQIAVEKTDFGKFNAGLLKVGYYDTTLFSFLNVGSSGTLVAYDQARFCGVVVGKHDYSNSAGGTGHAIQVVGMWDLPQNKPDAGK